MNNEQLLFEVNVMTELSEYTKASAEFYSWYKNHFLDYQLSFSKFQEDSCVFALQYGVFIEFFKSWIYQKEDHVLKSILSKIHCMESIEAKQERIKECFRHINYQLGTCS